MIIGPRCILELDETNQELNAAGTRDFGCRGFDELFGIEEGDDLAWHWHEGFEAILCTEGSLGLAVGNGSITLKPGMAVFINAWRPHCASGAPRARIRSVVFDEALVSGGPGMLIAQRYTAPLKTASNIDMFVFGPGAPAEAPFAEHLARAVDELEAEEPGFEIRCREHLSQMILLAWQRADALGVLDIKGSAKSERVSLMRAYVAEHYAESVSVAQIAAAAGICERECLRCFRESLGVTPSRYLLMHRLAKAAELLVSTSMSISDISHAVGINSPSNFTQLFRRDYRCTPREYRKRAQERVGRREAQDPRNTQPRIQSARKRYAETR